LEKCVSDISASSNGNTDRSANGSEIIRRHCTLTNFTTLWRSNPSQVGDVYWEVIRKEVKQLKIYYPAQQPGDGLPMYADVDDLSRK